MSDIVERLRRTLSDLPGNDDDLFNEIHAQRDEAANEIERLRRNAKSDTQLLAAYHKWCQMNGCAPSSRDLSIARATLEEEKK